VLLDSPQFLWVTNGLSIWGREAAVRRMADYHTAEVWHIQPDDAKAVAVEVSPEASMCRWSCRSDRMPTARTIFISW
jgi:hypothetical protein